MKKNESPCSIRIGLDEQSVREIGRVIVEIIAATRKHGSGEAVAIAAIENFCKSAEVKGVNISSCSFTVRGINNE